MIHLLLHLMIHLLYSLRKVHNTHHHSQIFCFPTVLLELMTVCWTLAELQNHQMVQEYFQHFLNFRVKFDFKISIHVRSLRYNWCGCLNPFINIIEDIHILHQHKLNYWNYRSTYTHKNWVCLPSITFCWDIVELLERNKATKQFHFQCKHTQSRYLWNNKLT